MTTVLSTRPVIVPIATPPTNEVVTVAPPASPQLSTLAVPAGAAPQAGPLASLGDLAKKIAGLEATKPEPAPRPRVFRRRELFFD